MSTGSAGISYENGLLSSNTALRLVEFRSEDGQIFGFDEFQEDQEVRIYNPANSGQANGASSFLAINFDGAILKEDLKKPF